MELVLDHQFFLNDDGASMILRGIAAPSIFSQTIRYSKVSLDLAKKSTLYGKKNRFGLPLVVCPHHFRGYSCNLAIIEGLTKKP